MADKEFRVGEEYELIEEREEEGCGLPSSEEEDEAGESAGDGEGVTMLFGEGVIAKVDGVTLWISRDAENISSISRPSFFNRILSCV